MQDDTKEKVKKESQTDSSSDSDDSTDGTKRKDDSRKRNKEEFSEDIFKMNKWDNESDMEDLLELEKIELEKRKKFQERRSQRARLRRQNEDIDPDSMPVDDEMSDDEYLSE